VVHLVRHGQGVHNVAAALYGGPAYRDPALKDALLDDTGKAQARALGQRIRDARIHVDVVLVSPLTRALQTATLMFEGGGGGEGEGAGGGAPSVPMDAVELCREAHGGHPCDQRRARSVIEREFPHVSFTGIATDADTWHDPDRRETVRDVSVRCDAFLEVLRARKERNIVVVSHGVFLETLLNRSALVCTDDAAKVRRFENCEMRSIVLGGWG
jgi:broad specificity phosphatase PhoE